MNDCEDLENGLVTNKNNEKKSEQDNKTSSSKGFNQTYTENPENVSFEELVMKEGNITLWMKYAIIGDVEILINDKLILLSKNVDGNIRNLWDCLFDSFIKSNINNFDFKNSSDLKDIIYSLQKKQFNKYDDVEHYAMKNLSLRYNIQIIISSIDHNLIDIVYGKHLLRSFHILHVGCNFFLQLKPGEDVVKYELSEEDKKLIDNMHTIPSIQPVDKVKLKKERKHLNDMRKMLRGMEYFEHYEPNQFYKNKGKLQYEIHSSEELNEMEGLLICQLKMTSAHSGRAIPLVKSDEIDEIILTSRTNCGYNAFENDLVYVKVHNNKHGKVMGIFESYHKPVNSIYICKVSQHQGSLMSPIDKSFPKIHVDNYEGRKKYNEQLKSSTKKYQNQTFNYDSKRPYNTADNIFYTMYTMNKINSRNKVVFILDSVNHFNPETCDFYFMVCYEYWKPHFLYPFGKIVGILSTYDSLKDSFHLISAICNLEPLDITTQYQKEVKEIEKKCETITKVPNTYLPPGSMVFTIDSEKTKDMDDAISYHKEGEDIVIGIHISDVTKYISSNHDVYQQALRRFCTSYPPQFSNIQPIHIFDTKLSNNMFSLVPGESRAVVSVFFRFNHLIQSKDAKNFEIAFPTFKTGFIISQYKLNYEDVSNSIRHLQPLKNINSDLFFALTETYKIAKVIRRSRLPDTYFVRSENNGYLDYKVDTQFEAKMLVEEFMLLANEYVAKKIYENYSNLTLLRIQEPVKSYIDWVDKLYQHTNMDFTAQLKYYCQLVQVKRNNQKKQNHLVVSNSFHEKFREYMRDDIEKAKNLLQYDSFYNDFYIHITEWYAISNSARYVCSLENSSSNCHFSLNKPLYTHFTSPIRRFTDIIVHRLLKSIINDSEINITPSDISEVCSIANKRYKANNTFEKICAPFAIFEETDKTFCFVLDCICSEINNDKLSYIHPLLQNSNSIKSLRFAHMSLSKSPLEMGIDDKKVDCCTLKWKKIIYSYPYNETFIDQENEIIIYEPGLSNNNINNNNTFTVNDNSFNSYIPSSQSKLFREIRESDLSGEELREKLITLETNFVKSSSNNVISSEGISVLNPIIKIKLKMYIKNTLRIQFCKYNINGLQNIYPELFIISPTYQICLIHHMDPVRFFVPGGKLNLNHNSRKDKFDSIDDYKAYFEPLIKLESLVEALGEKSAFTLLNVPIKWVINDSSARHVKERYGIMKLSYEFCKSRHIIFSEERDEILDRYEYLIAKGFTSVGSDLLCLRHKTKQSNKYWVGHGEVVHVGKCIEENIPYKVIIFILTQCDFQWFPNNNEINSYTIDVYSKSVSSKRQQKAIETIHKHQLLKNVILGDQSLERIASDNQKKTVQFLKKIRANDFFSYNENQFKAVKNAMNQKLSLIWGPPGTGKTEIGCLLSYVYSCKNKARKKGVILYCGPSNECVNLVACKMVEKLGEICPKMLRIFGEQQELSDFPIPGKFVKSHTQLIGEIEAISLHHLIRNDSDTLKKFDATFKSIMESKNTGNISGAANIHDYILTYKEIIKETKQKLIKNNKYDIVLCTTSVTATKIMKLFNFTQIIIDEAGMCKEPETLIPISMSESTVENVVLIGDHQQLRPIVRNNLAKSMGLQISLFERYQKLQPNLLTMLNYQYRMHPSICEFPSNEFYSGDLKTQTSKLWTGISSWEMKDNFNYNKWNGIDYSQVKPDYKVKLHKSNYDMIPNDLWPGKRQYKYSCFPSQFDYYPERIIFINVIGDESTQSVTTSAGHENSKANLLEVEAVGFVYEKLIDKCFQPRRGYDAVMVITQYRLQMNLLEKKCKLILLSKKLHVDPIVKTVNCSQGSENDYIIFSTVRSLRNNEDINPCASPGWENQHLGYITDPNQVNVALTRAKKGLIIIGNANLLCVNTMWNKLIRNLKERKCFIENYLDFPLQ